MERKLSIFFLITLVLVEFVSSQNGYCNIESCGDRKSQHTLCRYRLNAVSPNCAGSLGGGLSVQEKKDILRVHNHLRQRVALGKELRGRPGPQPAATNIQRLRWDDELEKIAQTWADQCIWEHDKCRNVARYNVGQNLARAGTTGDFNSINILDMVRSWYKEVKHFNNSHVSHFEGVYASNGEQVGHYTQFVWAKTNKLGCGLRSYVDDRFNTKYLVCNYGPSGNWRTQPLYQQF